MSLTSTLLGHCTDLMPSLAAAITQCVTSYVTKRGVDDGTNVQLQTLFTRMLSAGYQAIYGEFILAEGMSSVASAPGGSSTNDPLSLSCDPLQPMPVSPSKPAEPQVAPPAVESTQNTASCSSLESCAASVASIRPPSTTVQPATDSQGECCEKALASPTERERSAEESATFRRHDLDEAEQTYIASVLVQEGFISGLGRPMNCLGLTLNGIFFVLRTGCPWRDVNEAYGSWNTLYKAFRSLTDIGAFEALSRLTTEQANLLNTANGKASNAYVDSTSIRVHQHACGARKDAEGHEDNQAIGRSRGGNTTKIHAVVDDNMNFHTCFLTPGQVHDSKAFDDLMKDVEEGEFGHIVADKAYGSREIRTSIEEKGSTPCIPPKSNAKSPCEYNKEVYGLRNIVERAFCMLKNLRRMSTRYEKLVKTFRGMLHFAATICAIRKPAMSKFIHENYCF